ncbi:oxalate/formate antiporter [Photobacterium aphoticum]|uniref:Oxalate/formate antiporter n=1 Tax=Photobacterium aphoticum TaxID=754436 RepID=A0A090QWF9_9GAMM|nr:oxalate/formate antiporter [Photobacterium aphoticum]
MIAFIMQGINMALFATFTSDFTLMIGAALAGVGYGTLLAVFPSITADYYGLKNYGANYGVLYTAWGVSGFIGLWLQLWRLIQPVLTHWLTLSVRQ